MLRPIFGFRRGRTSRRRDERGVETVTMLIAIPFLFVLILALIDVGMMIRTRIVVESIARDAARNAAADGGNRNPRTNLGQPWSDWAEERLIDNGRCVQSQCKAGELPTVNCSQVTPPGGSTQPSEVAYNAGDLITCTIEYPYKGINEPLLNSPFGLGMGSLIKEFEISISARAETGTNG